MAVVEYEKKDHLVTITMNRPERLNAMGKELVIGLADAWTDFQNDDDAWVGIITGVGRAFCVGMDVKERVESGEKGLGLDPATQRDPYSQGKLNKPTIAAVNGFAFGGGYGMAARADFRVAGESAKFQFTEIVRGSLGIYAVQDVQSLTSGVAAELALGGILSGQRMYEAGFANRVVPDDQLMVAAHEIADSLLALPPLSVRHTVELMHKLRDLRSELPPEVQKLVKEYSDILRNSEDGAEAVRSFAEKRAPVFQAR